VAVTEPTTLEVVEAAVDAFVAGDPGRSVAVVSVRGVRVQAEVRAGEPRPAASLLKVPLAAAVWDLGTNGELDLEASVRRAELPSSRYPSVLAPLAEEHEFTIREACGMCLATSDNALADYLLDLVGWGAVNAVLDSWGCWDSRFGVGFDDGSLGDGGRANVTTARDALTMVTRICRDRRYGYLAEAMASSLSRLRIGLRLPSDVVIRHKTGTLPGVCNDVGIVEGRRTDLALAFLCDRQPDSAACGTAIGDCVASIRAAVEE
jgi:beta-lactamase class A